MSIDELMGDEPAPQPDSIPIPPQLKYGVFIGETSDELGEPVVVIHRSPGFEAITFGHILRLLLYCVENIRTELMWQKFQSKRMQAQAQQSQIVTPGHPRYKG